MGIKVEFLLAEGFCGIKTFVTTYDRKTQTWNLEFSDVFWKYTFFFQLIETTCFNNFLEKNKQT